MNYSEEEMIEMTLEIDAIVDLMKAIEHTLETAKSDKETKPDNNVITMDFSILPEFERLRNAHLKLPQVLAVYHDWAQRTFSLCQQNAGRLRKGKLREHVEKCLAQVKTIQLIFPEAK